MSVDDALLGEKLLGGYLSPSSDGNGRRRLVLASGRRMIHEARANMANESRLAPIGWTRAVESRSSADGVTVGIVDQFMAYAYGLAALIEQAASDVKVTVISDSLDELLHAEGGAPHVVLVDQDLPGLRLEEFVTRLADANDECGGVLLMTVSPPLERARELLRSGVRGVLAKDQPVDAFITGIRAVTCGGLVVLDGDLLAAATAPLWDRSVDDLDAELLSSLARGESNRVIARRFEVSERTVRRRLDRLYWSLGVTSRHEAMVYALRQLS